MKIFILLLVAITLIGCMPKRETYVVFPSEYPSSTILNLEYQKGYEAGYRQRILQQQTENNYRRGGGGE